MKKSLLTAVVLSCCMSAALFVLGCAKSASKAKLVYWSMWNEAEPQGMVIAQAAQAFTKATGITVDVNFNGREIRKTLQPALDAGETIERMGKLCFTAGRICTKNLFHHRRETVQQRSKSNAV